jgi:hypothetical protein
MKLIRKTYLRTILTFILVPFLLLCDFSRSSATINTTPFINSGPDSSKVREVFLSQQLFVVEVSKIKRKNTKHHRVHFKAENRDAFMITCYKNDTSYTELYWTMCSGGICPVAGTYKFGTPGYKQLDSLIAQAKQSKIKLKKKPDPVMADVKKVHLQ